MFNSGVRSNVVDELHETVATSQERVRDANVNRKLQFEGTVEVEGTFTGQMLNALFGPDSQVNGKLRFEGAVQIDGTFTGSITTNDHITSPTLAIEKGALFDGNSSMRSTPNRSR